MPENAANAPGLQPAASNFFSAISGGSKILATSTSQAGGAWTEPGGERLFRPVRGGTWLQPLDEKRDGLSMEELPYVLIEVHDPDPMPLIARFLSHPKAEIVASAVEAIVERADPSAIPQLTKLRGDRREVTMPELEDEKVTLGDLIEDALAFFEEAMGEEEEAPAPEKAPAARGPAGNERGGRRR